MTIADIRGKCKSFLGRIPRDVLLVSILVGASTLSFFLGFWAGAEEVGQGSGVAAATPPTPTDATTTQIVASKFGTKYYLTSCASANRISPANKIFFPNASAAIAAGYTKAGNCPGL